MSSTHWGEIAVAVSIIALAMNKGTVAQAPIASSPPPKQSSTDEPVWKRSPGAAPRPVVHSDPAVGKEEASPIIMASHFSQLHALPQPATALTTAAPQITFRAPPIDPGRQGLPITLPAALQLVNVRALDIAASRERLRVAAAQLYQANVLWLPTISMGADYYRHDGPNQSSTGTVADSNYDSLMAGLGSGFGTGTIIPVNDAIFAPLSARQVARARGLEIQATTNDAFLAVSEAYFNVQQARGELAGAIDATKRTQDLVDRIEKLAAGLVSPVEATRAKTELVRRQQTELIARERWRVASAELLRLLHLQQGVQLVPLEPPSLSVDLVDTDLSVEELITTGLNNRPELASQQAQVQALLTQVRQEKMRPFIPSVLLRGASTSPGTLGYGVFEAGNVGSLNNYGQRFDIDVQLLWQFENLGFGNRSRVLQRQAESRLANIEFLRTTDRVSAEISQAHAQAELAALRRKLAETGLRFAIDSAEKNLAGLGQTRRVGDTVTMVFRPQEAVASVQALGQAYADYYGSIADANRAQFRLYRALGNPGQWLLEKLPCDRAIVPNAPPVAPPTGNR